MGLELTETKDDEGGGVGGCEELQGLADTNYGVRTVIRQVAQRWTDACDAEMFERIYAEVYGPSPTRRDDA